MVKQFRQAGSVFLGVATLALCALPAKADWQFTRWGMTPDEFVRNASSRLWTGDYCPKITDLDKDYTINFVSYWKLGNTKFTACYLFKNGKLRRINLYGNGGGVGELIDNLSAGYGVGDVDNSLEPAGIYLFTWRTPTDRIMFLVITASPMPEYPYWLIIKDRNEPQQ